MISDQGLGIPALSAVEWVLAGAAALGVGVSKAGLAGVSLLHVLIFAFLFGARDSTGIVLPLLVVGDLCAVGVLHRHARWDYVWRMLAPACVGVAVAAFFMRRISDAAFRPLIGGIVLALAVLHIVRVQRPGLLGDLPHTLAARWGVGFVAGVATMLANAAGPVMAIYCLAVALPKFELVGTLAWFFFIINVYKLPFSAGLGLIRTDTLLLNAVLVPGVIAGVLSGRWLVERLPQRTFDVLMLAFAIMAALRLIAG
jgi:uncharacterized protein